MPYLTRHWLLVLTLLCCSALVRAEDYQQLSVIPQAGPYTLGEQWQYVEDPTGRLAFSQIRQLPDAQWQWNNRPDVNFGYRQSAIWLRLTLHNPLPVARSWYLRIGNPLLDEVDVFLNGLHIQSGDQRPFKQRPNFHRQVLVPIELAAEASQDIYLRIASQGSLHLDASLLTPKQLMNDEQRVLLLQGGFFGAMLVMLLYNLLLTVLVRQRVYLNYCAFVLCFALYQWAQLGFGFQWLWPDSLWWQQRSFIVFAALSALFACLFTWDALQIRQMSRGFRVVGRGLIGLCLLALLLGLLMPYQLALLSSFAVVGLCTVCAVIFALRRWLQGHAPAKLFALGWGVLVIATFLHVLSGSGVLPIAGGTLVFQQIGALLEVVIFAYALSSRIRQAEVTKQRAQKALIRQEKQQREQQAHTLALQRSLNEQLEQRIRERTQALEQTLQELSSANQRLARLSREDGLTGLYNRQAFNEFLLQAWHQAERYKNPLAVLIMDMDHFKQINDQHGHLAGDTCLRQVAELIKNSLRQSDICARYGGEEFIALLPNTDVTAAELLAERIRLNVQSHPGAWDGQTIALSLSLGVSAITPHSQSMTATELIDRADRALYQAKAAGRNRVVRASTA